MPRFYCYTYAYPPELEGGRVFYVGKGAGRRIDHHEYSARNNAQDERSVIIRAIWASGHKVVKTKVLETDDEPSAHNKEKELITRYGLENLLNRNRGGGGISRPPEMLKQITPEEKQAQKRNQMRRYLDGRTAVPLRDADIETFKAWAEVQNLISTRGKGIGTGNVADLVCQLAAAYRHAPDVLDACLTAILADIPDSDH